MSLSPQELLAEYRIAFRNANPDSEIPKGDYSHGWFRFDERYGVVRYRRAYFVQMLDNLRERVNKRTAALSSDHRGGENV